jgi:hypothetical protein
VEKVDIAVGSGKVICYSTDAVAESADGDNKALLLASLLDQPFTTDWPIDWPDSPACSMVQ